MDGAGAYSCEGWGGLGEPGIPIIIDTDQFFLWFMADDYPDFAIINHEMIVAQKFVLFDFDSINTALQTSLDICNQCETVGVAPELRNRLPEELILLNPYPNPFNPVTTLRYDLPEQAAVNILIYDMLGRQVKTLINQTQDAGYKSVIWDATNDYGKRVSAGIYLYQIQAGEYIQTKKMVLLK